MSILLILVGIVGFLWLVARVKTEVETKSKSKMQEEYLNAFLSDVSQKQWIEGCVTSDDLLEKGRDRLWRSGKLLRNKINRLRKSEWRLDPNDNSIVEEMITINKIVLAMVMTECGDMSFEKDQSSNCDNEGKQ